MPDVGMTPQVGGRAGAMFVGLDATPTGSDPLATAVLDFTGATQVDFTGYASNIAPVTPTHSQTLGSTFKINMPGVWTVTLELPVATAASVLAGINLDGAAAELVVATALSRTAPRNVAIGKRVAAAADSEIMRITTTVRIPKDSAYQIATGTPISGGVIRFLVTNNAAGAAPAATLAVLAEARAIFDYVGPVSPE